MDQKFFTPKEANRRLPLVRQIVADILQKGQLFQDKMTETEGEQMSEECMNLKAEIQELLEELEDLGCYFKDWNFEIGLVDFPSIIDGQEVLLCWKSDEPEVRWYHAVNDGFDARLPIPKHLLN